RRGADGADPAGGAGDRARHRAAGRDAVGLRGRVCAPVGQAGRDRRRARTRDHHCGGAADPGARAGEPGAAAGKRDSEAGRKFLRGGARPPTQEVVAFIDANRDDVAGGLRLTVESICTVLRAAGLQVAVSTYYAARTRPPSARAVRDAELSPMLRNLWDDNYRVYG